MPKVDKQDTKLDPKAAREALEKERQERQAICIKEVQEVLKKYGCVIDGSIMVSARGNEPLVRIIAQ